MGVFDRSAGGFSVIFEDEYVAEALVVLEVEHAVAVTPEDVFHRALAERGQRGGVIGRLDDHFVRADAVHLVEKTFALAPEIAFDAKRRKFIGNHAHAPAGRVGAAVRAAVDKNFRRRFCFVARTEGAILAIGRERDAFAQEVVGAFSALGGNNYPAAGDWVFTKLRQRTPP